MQELWPYVSWVITSLSGAVIFVGGWLLRDGIQKANIANDLTGLRADIAELKGQMQHVDEAIRGNGKTGLVTTVGILGSQVFDVIHRIEALEKAAA